MVVAAALRAYQTVRRYNGTIVEVGIEKTGGDLVPQRLQM